MTCPFCKSENHFVNKNKRSFKSDRMTIRYRKCNNCGMTFTTRETYSEKTLNAVKNGRYRSNN